MYIRVTGGLVTTHIAGVPQSCRLGGEVQQPALPTSSQGVATMLLWEPYFVSENFKVSGDMKIRHESNTYVPHGTQS